MKKTAKTIVTAAILTVGAAAAATGAVIWANSQMTCVYGPPPTEYLEQPEYGVEPVQGDLNDDGQADLDDMRDMLAKLQDKVFSDTYDMNSDSKLDDADLELLKKILIEGGYTEEQIQEVLNSSAETNT